MDKKKSGKRSGIGLDRRTFLTTAIPAGSLRFTAVSRQASNSETTKKSSVFTTAMDFSRSFCHYIPKSAAIWVRIQAECRCQVFDRGTNTSDEYILGVRTQTGLRTKPTSDALDPGYDFWMIFAKNHIFTRRVHTSSYNQNSTRNELDDFLNHDWRLQRCPAAPLRSGTEVTAALKAWKPLVARTEFASKDGSRTYTIEYPVKWADGNPDNTFRVETGPVVLLDPERVQVGKSPNFADFQWAYLDYNSFDQVRCFLERPTSILSGATYKGSPKTPRRNPALTNEHVAQIERRLYSGWKPPIAAESLRKLLQTDHYSEVVNLPVVTKLFALEETPCDGGRPADSG